MDVYSLNNDVINACEPTGQPECFEALIPSPPELAVVYCASPLLPQKFHILPQNFTSIHLTLTVCRLPESRLGLVGWLCFRCGLSGFGSRLQAGPRSAPHVSHPTRIRIYLVHILVAAPRCGRTTSNSSTSTFKALLKSCSLTFRQPKQSTWASPTAVGQGSTLPSQQREVPQTFAKP